MGPSLHDQLNAKDADIKVFDFMRCHYQSASKMRFRMIPIVCLSGMVDARVSLSDLTVHRTNHMSLLTSYYDMRRQAVYS